MTHSYPKHSEQGRAEQDHVCLPGETLLSSPWAPPSQATAKRVQTTAAPTAEATVSRLGAQSDHEGLWEERFAPPQTCSSLWG